MRLFEFECFSSVGREMVLQSAYLRQYTGIILESCLVRGVIKREGPSEERAVRIQGIHCSGGATAAKKGHF